MKSTVFCQWLALGSLSMGGLSQSVWADGPSDLEALAEKAKQAAEESVRPAKKKIKEVAEKAKETAEEKNEEEQEAVEQMVGEAKAEAKGAVKVDLAKRAEKLGLLANLSPDVSAVMALSNGGRVWEELTESGVGQLLLETLLENEVDLTDPDSPGAQVAALFEEEFLIASGKGATEQLKNMISLNSLSDKYEIAQLIRLWTIAIEGDDALPDTNPFGALAEAIKENPDFLSNLVAASEMPPLLIAARVSDDEQRDELAAVLAMGGGMALQVAGEDMPFLSSSETEVAGISFAGIALDGESLVKSLQEEIGLLDLMETFMDPASAQDILDSLAEKNLVLLGGVSDEAVYLYLGSSAEDLPLVEKTSDGLTASEEFAFVDAYLDEMLVNVFWMEEDLVEVGATGQAILGDYIDGILMGLKDNDALGNIKNLEKKLLEVQRLEKKFLASGISQAAAGVSFLKADGLHTESFGGYLDEYYDWETPHQLGSVSGDSFFSVQGVSNVETDQLAMQYIETAFASAYEIAGLMKKMEGVPADFDEVLAGFELFDERMKGDALELWKGLRLTEAGVGAEWIFELDLAGSWPTVPGVPELIIEKGMAPRLSYVAPVVDRAKLAESWKEVEGATAQLLKAANELTGEEIPMQKPMSSENNGLKTWFFPIPMQTDDFVPSITLDDEVMVMGTSKERAVALAQAAKEKSEGRTGVVTVMNFAPLWAFLSNWLALIEENPEEILRDDEQLEFFRENQEMLKKMLTAMEEFDSWTTHKRVVDGQLRSSSHFKTK